MKNIPTTILLIVILILSGCSKSKQDIIPKEQIYTLNEVTHPTNEEREVARRSSESDNLPSSLLYENRSGFDFSQEKIINKQRTIISGPMSDEENINGNNTSSGILLTIHREDLGIEVQYVVSRNDYITHQQVLLNNPNWSISYQDFIKLDLVNIKLQGISETLFTNNIGERGKITVVGYQRRKHHNPECAPDDLSSRENSLELLDISDKPSKYKLMSEKYDYRGNEEVMNPMPSPISGCRKNDPLGGSAIPLQLRVRDNFGIIVPYHGFGNRRRVASIKPI